MRLSRRPKRNWILASAITFTIALLLFGCSGVESPTSSQTTDERPLWSPAPGDELAPGRAVPIVEEGYWEDLYGPSVNPFRRAVATPIVLDEDGGTVTLGLHRYVIPAGAVREEVAFTIAYASMNGVGIDCGPSPFSFDSPVTVTLSYSGTQYENDSDGASRLQIWYAAPDGTFEALESRVDNAARTVSADVDHFSRYILG